MQCNQRMKLSISATARSRSLLWYIQSKDNFLWSIFYSLRSKPWVMFEWSCIHLNLSIYIEVD